MVEEKMKYEEEEEEDREASDTWNQEDGIELYWNCRYKAERLSLSSGRPHEEVLDPEKGEALGYVVKKSKAASRTQAEEMY